MQARTMSPSQLRKAGLSALVKSLDPTGMARFIQQFDIGAGDYTKERSKWQDQMSIDEIILGINKTQKANTPVETK